VEVTGFIVSLPVAGIYGVEAWSGDLSGNIQIHLTNLSANATVYVDGLIFVPYGEFVPAPARQTPTATDKAVNLTIDVVVGAVCVLVVIAINVVICLVIRWLRGTGRLARHNANLLAPDDGSSDNTTRFVV
jgi:uncharacterized alkaline shock family protein YloU